MIINRVWAMPNKWTFTIKPIAELLARYVGNGKGWVDPFAGENSPAEFTNDINTERLTKYHLDAFEFAKIVEMGIVGVLFDPPYSVHQVVEVYEGFGQRKQSAIILDILGNKVINGGLAICCGWNSNGFGKGRGFEIEEILLVAHGGGHNDTIVIVERKIKSSFGAMK